jgi:hypothetical protein
VAASGCTSLASSVSSDFARDFASDLSNAILDSADVETVRAGAPAYLILIDGLLVRAPDDVDLLRQAATLNSAYGGAFVTDPERASMLATKARSLAFEAACLGFRDGCDLATRPFAGYVQWLAGMDRDDVELLYTVGSSWAGWIQANSDDFNAIAELGRVRALMERVVALDESWDHGGAHVYLGIFETLLPQSLGGRPEQGRAHFERAISLSQGRYLMAKVMFAEQYARLVFDRELHDELVAEVLEADARQPGITLVNTVAKERAVKLRESADDYF